MCGEWCFIDWQKSSAKADHSVQTFGQDIFLDVIKALSLASHTWHFCECH
jgi:hypothetical protein